MNASNIKGALLEYIVRSLLKNCGFTNVKAYNLYSYERGGLFYVNGRGAAHDADIIMNPPIQMPFSYPTQLIFECKAYEDKAKLPIVRNALGLRNDLNEFEIVTKASILKRQNNRRASYAIEKRARFIYQIGVASVNGFSKPAFEFAANNKIPLLSLDWFLSSTAISKFNSIDQSLINGFSGSSIQNLYDFLKDRNGDLNMTKYIEARIFLESDNILGEILETIHTTINYSFVGLLETGDMVFLTAFSDLNNNILSQVNGLAELKAEIHWKPNSPNVWRLTVYIAQNSMQRTDYNFFLPERIFQYWERFNFDKSIAINIKQEFLSKIFVFNGRNNPEVPFSIININRHWLEEAIQSLDSDENKDDD